MKSFYLAGDLFHSRVLAGNALLADAIEQESKRSFRAILPQLCEPRANTAPAIRNSDIRDLLTADAALFVLDSPDVDSGTVAELLIAKFADIPSVLLRTDFRNAGDNQECPWNLMLGFYPRTEFVEVHGMNEYRACIERMPGDGAERSVAAMTEAMRMIARRVLSAFDRVLAEPPRMPKHLRSSVYEWLRLFPASGFDQELSAAEMARILARRFESHD